MRDEVSARVELADSPPGFELSLSSESPDDLIEAATSGALNLVDVEIPDDTPDRLNVWPVSPAFTS
ncbi:hypothetical protein [Sphingomonas faeni]|uniref:hypothetical protein n=1 Tax=Sphingomonas faeni TaxID=185950 RepID=UPI00335BEEF1